MLWAAVFEVFEMLCAHHVMAFIAWTCSLFNCAPATSFADFFHSLQPLCLSTYSDVVGAQTTFRCFDMVSAKCSIFNVCVVFFVHVNSTVLTVMVPIKKSSYMSIPLAGK